MKIAMLVLNPISRDARIRKEARDLSREGHELTVIGMTSHEFHLENETMEGFDIIRIPVRSLTVDKKKFEAFIQDFNKLPENPSVGVLVSSISYWCVNEAYNTAVIDILAQLNPDIVHCNDANTLWAGTEHKKKTRSLLLYDSHEIFEETTSLITGDRRRWEHIQRECSGYVDAFVTVNQSLADYLSRKYPKLPKPVVVMNAINLPERRRSHDFSIHEKAGLSPEIKIALFHGGITKGRGLEILAESARYLKEEWAIVFMGSGPYVPEIQKIISCEGLEEKVKIIPPAPYDELLYWAGTANVGIIPYRNVGLNNYYCTPNKLWEYPGSGIPVICSPFPELKRAIKKYEFGVLLPREDFDARDIANTINNLDEKTIDALKVNCRRFVTEESWTKYSERLLGVYRSLQP